MAAEGRGEVVRNERGEFDDGGEPELEPSCFETYERWLIEIRRKWLFEIQSMETPEWNFRTICKNKALLFDYRVVIQKEFEKRKGLSPKYSMRDFAKALGLVPSHLHGILKRTKGLSPKRAFTLIKALVLDTDSAKQFILLVRARSSRARGNRQWAISLILREKRRAPQRKLEAVCAETRSWNEQVRRFVLGPGSWVSWVIETRARGIGMSFG